MNWLTIAAIVFVILMAGYGASKGLVKMIMSFASVLLAVVIVSMIRIPVGDFLKAHTSVYEQTQTGIENFVNAGADQAVISIGKGAESLIDSLNLPDVLKESLLKGDTASNYAQMGVSSAKEYVTQWLTELAFAAIVYALSFAIVQIGLWILMAVLNTAVKLPGIKQINGLAGAAVGVILALLFLWVGGVAVTAAAGTEWGQAAAAMIEESPLLRVLYDGNFLLGKMMP